MNTLQAIADYLKGRYILQEYPALHHQYKKWIETQPLKGIQVLDATPVFQNTCLKYTALLAAGAKLSIGISEKLPYDSSCLHFLQDIGLDIIPDTLHTRQFDIIADCGALFSSFTVRMGYVELTRSGYYGYQNSRRPVFLTDSGRIKEIETTLGTGDGYFRGLERLGYTHFHNRRIVVFGNGKVGRGIILCGQNRGAEVISITDIHRSGFSDCPIIDFRSSQEVISLIATADYIVSATGIANALAPYSEALCQSKAIIANMGIEDEFGAEVPLSRVLNEKRPLNFSLEEPTQLRYIDATMALDNEGICYLAHHPVPPGIFLPPSSMEESLIEVTRQNGLITEELNRLYRH